MGKACCCRSPGCKPDREDQQLSVDRNSNSSASEETIPALEERFSLDKREVVAGRVRVHIRNETSQQRLQAELRSEAVDIERVAINRELAIGEPVPAPREEEDGKILIIPVLEEVLVVEKRLVLREELRLRRTSTTRQVEEPVTVLRQHADIERLSAAGAGPSEHQPIEKDTGR
jgi:stress response protein YsnF